MKKNFLKLICVSGLAAASITANAQMEDVTKVLNGGIADANTLAKAYMLPYGEGFALGLANGWYNTAKPHKIFGFDLTLTAGIASIPSDKLTFDASKLDLKTLQVGAKKVGPTIAGEKIDGADLILRQTTTVNGTATTVETSFKMPQGVDFAYTPSMAIQAGIGLPMGSELMFRLVPGIKIGDYGKLGMWGLGVKHDIKQWIPVVAATPFWDMSIMAGYTSFKSTVTGSFLTPDPSLYYTTNVNLNDYNDQGVELKAKAFTANLLVSTNIPVFNVYGGIGITNASSELILTGKFPTPGIPAAADVAASIANGSPVKSGIVNVTNPISTKFDDLGTVFRGNIGARIKLLIITLHADVTFSGGYTMYTGGFGFSFR